MKEKGAMNISSLDTPKGDNDAGVKSAVPVIVNKYCCWIVYATLL